MTGRKAETIVGTDPVTGAVIRKRVFKGQRVIAYAARDENNPGLYWAVRGTLEEAHRKCMADTQRLGDAVGYVFPAEAV